MTAARRRQGNSRLTAGRERSGDLHSDLSLHRVGSAGQALPWCKGRAEMNFKVRQREQGTSLNVRRKTPSRREAYGGGDKNL